MTYSIAKSGSILEPQNKNFMKNLIKDDIKFDQLFLEGLESTANYGDDQDKFFSRKQVIFVNDR